MPIYEYQSKDPRRACPKCLNRFEVVQRLSEAPLAACPDCGRPVTKLISWCRAAVLEDAPDHARTLDRVREYERQGMWSHAAELADKHAEQVKDQGLKMRALDNYRKAGYDADQLDRHAQTENS